MTVTARSLIELRHAGESLGSPLTRVRAGQAGTYLSPYKGRGMEFEEHRLYQHGDDIRNIDWRVTARTGSPHTKVYREERERPVLFCVDFRRAMFFGTRGVFKSVAAARAAALLAWSSNHHRDRVGGFIFSESAHVELRPQRGKAAVLKLIRTLVRHGAAAAGTDGTRLTMDKPIMRLRRVVRPGSLVCIISDFREWSESAESHLVQIARHSAVWLLLVFDPLEARLPPAGSYRLSDGARDTVIHTGSDAARRAYARRYRQRHDHLEGLSRRHGMSLIPVSTRSDLLEVLRNELITRTAA